ncbi:protein PXR1 [Nematostella vectensis]|uniref:protein PXR1 n=1 Tax=Nematostella vectensis TaxID=45351 RepID=UPI0020779775|nr:protein PXR1 [Nematostella vectensis]
MDDRDKDLNLLLFLEEQRRQITQQIELLTMKIRYGPAADNVSYGLHYKATKSLMFTNRIYEGSSMQANWIENGPQMLAGRIDEGPPMLAGRIDEGPPLFANRISEAEIKSFEPEDGTHQNTIPQDSMGFIPQDNMGYRLLKKMGWRGYGTGLGKSSQGLAEPITATGVARRELGLGASGNAARKGRKRKKTGNETYKEQGGKAKKMSKKDKKSKQVPGEKSKQVPDKKSKQVPGEKSKQVPDKKSKQVPGEKSKQVPDKKNKQVPGEKSKQVPDEKSKQASGKKSKQESNTAGPKKKNECYRKILNKKRRLQRRLRKLNEKYLICKTENGSKAAKKEKGTSGAENQKIQEVVVISSRKEKMSRGDTSSGANLQVNHPRRKKSKSTPKSSVNLRETIGNSSANRGNNDGKSKGENGKKSKKSRRRRKNDQRHKMIDFIKGVTQQVVTSSLNYLDFRSPVI